MQIWQVVLVVVHELQNVWQLGLYYTVVLFFYQIFTTKY